MTHTVNTQLLDTSTTVALSQNSSSVQLDRIHKLDVTATFADVTPSDKTFTDTDVDAVENTVTVTAHGFTTGLKITALSSTGTLPAGLATSTVYYAIVVNANTIKFATSQANALAGTAVDITDAGTAAATNTIDVAATVAVTVKLQKNNNPVGATAVWVDLDDTEIDNGNNQQSVSAAGSKNWAIWNCGFREMRAVVAATSGAVTADIRVHGKGP